MELEPTLEHLSDPYVLQLIEALSKQDDEIDELTARVREAFMAGFEAGFSEGFSCEENPAHFELDCIDSPEEHYRKWLQETKA